MKTRTIDLPCQICGNSAAHLDVPLETKKADAEYTKDYVDIRCAQCETDHGTFRELLEDFKRETGDDESTAELFVLKHRKRADFRRELDKEQLKRAKNRDIMQ